MWFGPLVGMTVGGFNKSGWGKKAKCVGVFNKSHLIKVRWFGSVVGMTVGCFNKSHWKKKSKFRFGLVLGMTVGVSISNIWKQKTIICNLTWSCCQYDRLVMFLFSNVTYSKPRRSFQRRSLFKFCCYFSNVIY